MRNLDRYELWSVRVWTIGGIVVGLVVGVILVVGSGWSSTIVLAPSVFGLSAFLAARQHNWSVERYRRRRGGR